MSELLFLPLQKLLSPALLIFFLLILSNAHALPAQPPQAATAAFDKQIEAVEARLAQQHRSVNTFLAPDRNAQDDPLAQQARLRRGELIVERVSDRSSQADPNLSGALLHHWRGTAFAQGARAADFLRILRDFNAYPRVFSPEVLQAHVLSENGDHVQASMRIRQHHVITVVMDTAYDVTFHPIDNQHGYSISHSSRINEIDSPGTTAEHTLSPAQEHGFLWRLNTYWTYVEQDGGLYLQVEAVSLSRSVPTGLGWVVRPYVESIPRESLEFTLRSTVNALHK